MAGAADDRRDAAAWLADRLRDLGAATTLDEFELTGVKELQATPTFPTRGLDLAHRRDFAEQLSSAELAQPLAGSLTTPEETSWAGRWVVVPVADEPTLGRARAEGAAGLVVPRGVDDAGWMPKMIAGPPTGSVPIVSVRTDLHADFATRSGEQIAVSVPMRTIATTGTNVYGVLAAPGSDGLAVLLTAHFDGVGDDPSQRFPAAADNASGVAVVLEVARQLRHDLPSDVGLSVALLDGEEAGARGSAHHAPQVAPGTFVINVDGAARLADAAAVEAGGPA